MKKFFEATTSDKGILKRELMRQMVYLRAEELMTGKQALPIQTMDALELRMTLPKVTRFNVEQISEGALANYQMMEWFEINETMHKEQVRVLVTDEATARMQEDIQTRTSIEAASRGLAWSKDTDIFNTLVTGAGNSQPASGVWTDDATDIAGDVAYVIGDILSNTYLTDSDMSNIKLFYPIGLHGYLLKPIEIGQMRQAIRTFVEQNYRIQFVPTRQLTNKAMLILNSPETATHITYSGSKIPTSEEQRLPGVGNQYILTQYFKTYVMPEAEGGTTNKRIQMITGII